MRDRLRAAGRDGGIKPCDLLDQQREQWAQQRDLLVEQGDLWRVKRGFSLVRQGRQVSQDDLLLAQHGLQLWRQGPHRKQLLLKGA